MYRKLSVAVIPLLLAIIPVAIEAQETWYGCPIRSLRIPSAAQRDSLLRSLVPDEIALTGIVRDEATGEPVPGIVVTIDGTGLITRTGEDGGYVFRRLNRGDLPRTTMVRACDMDWSYLTEIREVMLHTPWEGTALVVNGVVQSNRGFAVQLDVVVRRRPNIF